MGGMGSMDERERTKGGYPSHGEAKDQAQRSGAGEKKCLESGFAFFVF